LTLPLAAVVVVFSRVLMRIFGHDFEVGWVILVIGSLGQLVNCAVGSVGYLLLMSGNQKVLVKIQVVTAVVTVGCCLLTVPRWGLAGAATAMALGNAGSNAWCLLEVKRVLGLFPYTRGYWRLTAPVLTSVFAALGLRFALQSVRPDILMVILAAAIVYAVFVGTVLMAGLEADDRLIASAIWSRVRNLLPDSQAGIA
jgi:O-antigen/teichoic acid export membrane protein